MAPFPEVGCLEDLKPEGAGFDNADLVRFVLFQSGGEDGGDTRHHRQDEREVHGLQQPADAVP